VLNRVKGGPAYTYYPANVANRPLPALRAGAAAPALQGPSVVQSERARVERALIGGDSEQATGDSGSGAPEANTASGEANPALMTRHLEPIAAPAPADELSAEVGGPVGGYESAEPEVEVVEASAAQTAATSNGYRDDHGRQGRRNRSRGQES
jgi:hypothetical protein